LSVTHKRQLYVACVLPIATYGYRLWYHPKARIKTITKCLASMQRTAAVWITGAFGTSPQGVCDIAGPPPIMLHVRKLYDRAKARSMGLPNTHPLVGAMGEHHALPKTKKPRNT